MSNNQGCEAVPYKTLDAVLDKLNSEVANVHDLAERFETVLASLEYRGEDASNFKVPQSVEETIPHSGYLPRLLHATSDLSIAHGRLDGIADRFQEII
jgi:hypothetical protein